MKKVLILAPKLYKNFQYLHDIENYMLEEHWELRQAATELMCNLTCYSETVKWFEDEKYDRLKVSFYRFSENQHISVNRLRFSENRRVSGNSLHSKRNFTESLI